MSRIQTLVLRQLSRQHSGPPWQPRLSASLRDDLGLDSLDFCELLNRLEDTFHILLRDDDTRQLRTVADVVRCVEQYLPSRR